MDDLTPQLEYKRDRWFTIHNLYTQGDFSNHSLCLTLIGLGVLRVDREPLADFAVRFGKVDEVLMLDVRLLRASISRKSVCKPRSATHDEHALVRKAGPFLNANVLLDTPAS